MERRGLGAHPDTREESIPKTEHGLEAGFGFFLQGAHHHIGEGLWDVEVGSFFCGRYGGMKDVTSHDLRDTALALVDHREGYGSDDGLVKQDPEGVDIRASVQVIDTLGELFFAWATALFGGHIFGGSHDAAIGGECGFLLEDRANKAKVEEFDDLAVVGGFVKEDIFGLDIAVNESGLVNNSEGFAEVGEYAATPEVRRRHLWDLEQGAKGFSVEQFHHIKEADIGLCAEVVDRDDIGCALGEVAGDLGLAAKALEKFVAGGFAFTDDLDGTKIAEFFVSCFEDDGHAADGDGFHQAVALVEDSSAEASD